MRFVFFKDVSQDSIFCAIYVQILGSLGAQDRFFYASDWVAVCALSSIIMRFVVFKNVSQDNIFCAIYV